MSPGKLFGKRLAELVLEAGDTHYRPSNGSEGEMFDVRWCALCTRDRAYREESGDGCAIIAAALCLNTSDALYPPEWTYDDDGQPCCTAFTPIVPPQSAKVPTSEAL